VYLWLLVGRLPKCGGLVFAGRVDTGFSDKVLANLYAKFQKLRQRVATGSSLPELLAQVKFTEWTHDDQLRQPVFLGLRTDKQPEEIVRE